MTAIWTLARKDLLLLLRDPRAAIILLLMPFLFIAVLGISLGEGFGQKPDDRLRISFVDLDEGMSDKSAIAVAPHGSARWADVVRQDLAQTASIRLERIASVAEAERLVTNGRRAAVLVFGPQFSNRVARCSFLADGINPFYRDGVKIPKRHARASPKTGELDAELVIDPTQETAAAIIEQVDQVTLLRVILPWMIGRAFEKTGEVGFIDMLGRQTKDVKFTVDMFADKLKKVKISKFGLTISLTDDDVKQVNQQLGPISLSEIIPRLSAQQKQELGDALQKAIQDLYPRYKLTAKTWEALTRSQPGSDRRAPTTDYQPEGDGLLKRGAMRYQVLVPSYIVMFAFFLVLTVGWLFVGERTQGTMLRLRAAPLTRTHILVGKLIPCYLISLFQGFVLLAAGRLVFGMSWGPEPLWLAPVVLTTSLAAMGLAILIAAVARTETQVSIYGTLIVLLLAGLSGAFMGDRSLMPPQMEHISHFTPHAWALDAYRQLLASSASPDIAVVLHACLVLSGFGVVFTVLAWLLLKLE